MKPKDKPQPDPTKMQDELIPRLRFPEFQGTGGWEKKPLGTVCDVLQGYGFPEAMQGKTKGKYPFFKVSDISRAVANSAGLLEKANNYVDDDDLSILRAKIIPTHTTVFAKIGEALRLNRRALVRSECLIDNNVVGLKAVQGFADDGFVYILSQLIDMNNHCGGAVPSVNKSTLEAIKALIPEVKEQQKIADCLSSLDELIAAEVQKLDTLKTHKKGLMQQLFPREGETIPRLRFPEFQDAGEWEVQALSHYIARLDAGVSVNSGDRPARSDEIGVLKTSCIIDGSFDPTENKVVQEPNEIIRVKEAVCANTIIISRMNTITLVGANAFVGNDIPNLFLPDRLWAAKANRFGNMRFIAYILGSAWGRAALSGLASGSSGTMKNIGKSEVLALLIVAPTIVEQQKIADCLSSLDELIAAEVQKLDALKTHKKGLMQQLFPIMDEAVG